MRRVGKTQTKEEQSANFGKSYSPHPTKTMWQRHVERYHLVEADTPQPNTQPQTPPQDIPEGKQFTTQELRRNFGFTKRDILRFRSEEKRRVNEEVRQQDREMFRERNKRIVEMRLDEELTLEQISQQVGITRERVRQILLNMERIAEVKFQTRFDRKKDVLMVAVRCRVCGKIRQMRADKHVEGKRYFCRAHHLGPTAYTYWLRCPEWFEMSKKERVNWRMHNDERVRARHRVSSMQVYLRNKDKPEYKERAKEYSRRHAAKMKALKEAQKKPPREWID